jgi:Fe-S-cluster containining protein
MMDSGGELADALMRIGFRCRQCGRCCREHITVLVGAGEVRRLMAATGMGWDEIVRPYPEFLETEDGCRYTFAWCLRHQDGQCIFLGDDGRCRVYADRPWICRTYPFMLTEEGLMVSACEGLGERIGSHEAFALAEACRERREAEDRELAEVERMFSAAPLPAGGCFVIDAEGVKPIHG